MYLVPLAVSLKSGWGTFWSSVSGAWAGLAATLTVIGVILVLVAVFTWIWQKRRGGGGASQGVLWTLVLGAIFAAPAVVIPFILTIVDFVINTIINLGNSLLK